MRTHTVLIILLFTLSCSKSKDGVWEDKIKLSERNIEFSASSDSITITTEGESWRIRQVSFNGKTNFEISENSSGRFHIQEEEFIIDRRQSNELFIRLTRNDTGSERILMVALDDGNYFDGIKITQKIDD